MTLLNDNAVLNTAIAALVDRVTTLETYRICLEPPNNGNPSLPLHANCAQNIFQLFVNASTKSSVK